jgi:hypothetical protein
MSALSFPFGPADAYAWPGGYPIGYLVDDGEFLCAACVNDPSNSVHAGEGADGWRLEGLQVLEGSAADYDGPVSCAHCGAVLVEGDEVSVQSLAAEAYACFEVARRATGDTATGPREDGERYWRCKDGTPDWVRDLVHAAHGGMSPDDWRYAAIGTALESLADGMDPEEGHDFADGYVDVYNHERLNWLASHSYRPGYVDDACEQFGTADGARIMDRIGLGQYFEACEVFSSVVRSLEARMDEVSA